MSTGAVPSASSATAALGTRRGLPERCRLVPEGLTDDGVVLAGVDLAAEADVARVERVRQHAPDRPLAPLRALDGGDVVGVERLRDGHLAHPGYVVPEDPLDDRDLLRDLDEPLLQMRPDPSVRERPRTRPGQLPAVASPAAHAFFRAWTSAPSRCEPGDRSRPPTPRHASPRRPPPSAASPVLMRPAAA